MKKENNIKCIRLRSHYKLSDIFPQIGSILTVHIGYFKYPVSVFNGNVPIPHVAYTHLNQFCMSCMH